MQTTFERIIVRVIESEIERHSETERNKNIESERD